jgi:hypothetical protein
MNYKRMLTGLKYAGFSITILGIISGLIIMLHPAYFRFTFDIDSDLAGKFGSFFGGFIGTLFTMITAILIFYTFINQKLETQRQQIEKHFFKMLDYHNSNVSNLSVTHVDHTKKEENYIGRRAFVVFKIQLTELLKTVSKINNEIQLNLTEQEIIDIAYVSFFYGIDADWQSFSQKKLLRYPRGNEIAQKLLDEKVRLYKSFRIGRTNQTSLSSYFRNMYRAIKYIDSRTIFTKDEKENYIKIFRAQLSNPELYVIFFNLISRFGKKWDKYEFVKKYEFIKNIPNNYCDPYDPKNYYKINFEEDELN